MHPKITPAHYYDTSPMLGNSPGDIWSGLPTHGLLGTPHVSGIVITPACDLANHKVDTVIYLPVIRVLRYYSTMAALPEIRQAIERQLGVADISGMLEDQPHYFPPDPDALDYLATEFEKLKVQSN